MALEKPGQSIGLAKESLPHRPLRAACIVARVQGNRASCSNGLAGEAGTLPGGKRLVFEERILHGEQLRALRVDGREELGLALALREVRWVPGGLCQHPEELRQRGVQSVLAFGAGHHSRLLDQLGVALRGNGVKPAHHADSGERNLRTCCAEVAQIAHGYILLKHRQHRVFDVTLVDRLAKNLGLLQASMEGAEGVEALPQ
mmetsp:Transcript_86443/g.189799  ORF Transcript_86443/g.189799 Transcript_86443/m.189799 type:complete len:202 (+) Transcript_86443:1535-2140(+)